MPLRTINTGKVETLLLGTSPFLRLRYCYLLCASNLNCPTSIFLGIRWYIECFWRQSLSGFVFIHGFGFIKEFDLQFAPLVIRITI